MNVRNATPIRRRAPVAAAGDKLADDRVSLALEEYAAAIDAGQPISRADLLTAYSDVAGELRGCLDSLDFIRQVAPQLNDEAPCSVRIAGAAIRPLATLGDFRIVRELGRGGMGVVYEAEQLSLGRRVALKVLPFAAMLDKQQLARFKNEARAAATLEHPNIVAVHGVGEERGVHYYSMQLVNGQSLAQVIAALRKQRGDVADPTTADERATIAFGAENARRLAPNGPTAVPAADETKREVQAGVSTIPAFDTPEYFRSVARLGIQAAEALDHAHANGVLHRDVKPANLLVDDAGKLWITDFGLARIEAEVGMTMTGDVLGTLRYMSPEQALAKRVVVDQRSDIYSLGVTLYELLSLQPAFTGDDRQDLLRQIAFDEPRPLRKVNGQIPQDLETIVLKAIEKSPGDRYGTAQELANDLTRYLQHQPITAKPATYVQQLRKWSRRHVAAAWTALAGSLLAAAILGVSTALVTHSRNEADKQRLIATQEKDKAVDQRNLAVEERNSAQLNQYFAEIVSGQTDLEQGNVARLHQKLIHHLPLEGESDRRGWEWYYLFSCCHPERRTLYHPSYKVFASWSPDGEYIATPGAIWNAKSGECVRLFTPSRTISMDVAWSPDSQQLAWGHASDDDVIYIWNRQTDAVRDLRGHEGSVWCMAFSPDGKLLASGSIDRTVKIWDVATGANIRTLQQKGGLITGVAWSPDGDLLAVGIGTALQIRNASTGESILFREEPGQDRVRVSWRPDGRQLAVNTARGWYLLDRSDWRIVLEHENPFGATNQGSVAGGDIKWNPSGTQLAQSHGNFVTVWNPTDDRLVSELVGHVESVNSVDWSPDGRQLVTADAFREIRIWELQRPPQPPAIATGGPLSRLSWESDSEALVSVAASDLTASSWKAADGTPLNVVKPAPHEGNDVGVLSPDGRLIARQSREADKWMITVRDAATGGIHAVWRPEASFAPVVYTWSPDGSKLAITIFSATHRGLECWDVDREQSISRWTRPKPHVDWKDDLKLPTWSPNGARVAVVGWGDRGDGGTAYWSPHVHVFDVASGRRVAKRPLANQTRYGGGIRALAWDPESHLLALGSSDGVLDVVDVEAQRGAMTGKASNVSITALDWSPDGKRLAAAGADGVVKVIEPRHGNDLLALRAAAGGVSHVAWSPDGKRLAAASEDGAIHVWDASGAYEFAATGSRQGELAWIYYNLADESAGDAINGALRKSVELAPRTLGYCALRGPALARLRQYDDAAKEFGAAVPAPTDLGLRFAIWRGYALLGARDLDAYRELRKSLVQALANSQVLSKHFDVAWLGAFIPNSVDGFENEIKRLRDELAKPDAEGNAASPEMDDWVAIRFGAMLYRLGQYADAIDALEKLTATLTEANDRSGNYEKACAQYFLAMARHKLGHDFQARRLLAQARVTDEALDDNHNLPWFERVGLNTLRREATGLIEPEANADL